MPYRVRKSKCRRSDGKRGSWVLAYKDKSGKSHSNCHTSKSGAEAQIAAIEGPKESLEYAGEKTMKLTSTQLRRIIAEEVEAAMTQAPRKKPAAAAAAPKAAPKKRVPTAAVIAGSIADLVGDGVPGDYMEAAEVLLSHMSEPRPDRDTAVEEVADVLGNAIMDSMMDAGDDDDMDMEMDFDAFGVASAVVDMYM